MRSESKNLLILDSGNLFFLKVPKGESQRREYTQKAEVLIRAYNAMGYDAANIGERDLIMGYRFLAESAKRTKFPFLSSNLTDKTGNSPPFVSHIIKDIEGLKVGIFGLIDDRALKGEDSMITASDPVTEARRVVSELREKCDMIIALSQLGEAKDMKLVQAIPDIDIIVGGVKAKTIRYEKVRNTIMARVIPRGGYLGVLGLRITRRGHPYRFQNLGNRDELLKKIERIRFQYQLIEDRIEDLSPGEKKVKLKEMMILRERERQLQTEAASYDAANTFRNETIPVNLRIEDDPAVAQFIEEYRRKWPEAGEKGMQIRGLRRDSPLSGESSAKRAFHYRAIRSESAAPFGDDPTVHRRNAHMMRKRAINPTNIAPKPKSCPQR